MSKQALYYYAENLALIRRAEFTTTQGKAYGIGENGRDLLVFLCDGANEKQGGCFYFSYRYVSEETGIPLSNVKRLFAGFEQLGWITRTGATIKHQGRGSAQIEWCLTFFPVFAEIMRTGLPTGLPRETRNLVKPIQNNERAKILGVETEPQPEPEPEQVGEKTKDEPKQVGKGGELETTTDLNADQLETVNECVRIERENYTSTKEIGLGLVKTWVRDYTRLVREHPDEYPQELYERRKHLTRTPPSTPTNPRHERYEPPRHPKGVDNCPTCNGHGNYQTYDETTKLNTSHWCPCTDDNKQKLKDLGKGLFHSAS